MTLSHITHTPHTPVKKKARDLKRTVTESLTMRERISKYLRHQQRGSCLFINQNIKDDFQSDMQTKFVCQTPLTRPQDTASLFALSLSRLTLTIRLWVLALFKVRRLMLSLRGCPFSSRGTRNGTYPSRFMVNYSEEEISAIGQLFPGSSISNCFLTKP